MRAFLRSVADRVADFLESLPGRHVAATASRDELRERLGRALDEKPTPVEQVIDELVRDADGGLVASGGPRFFGFVIGGATPASVAADWLTSAWDQNAQAYALSPAAAVVEEVVARWIVELLGLPPQSSVGLVTGCQMANLTALCVARNAVLARAGWDLEQGGLSGAPPLRVLMSEEGHATVPNALRMIGIGASQLSLVPADEQGRMILPRLAKELERVGDSPVIVSVQAGNVNTGAFEPIGAIADIVGARNAWIHVDGAFGLWAAVSPRLRPLLDGLERADSWATDAHKWLNVPYDSGIVVVKDPAAHRSLKTARCAYAGADVEGARDGSTWAPENSRRARAFVLYASLRALGRSGVREIVERCCEQAARFAGQAAQLPFARIVNEVATNQVLVRFTPTGVTDLDAFHDLLAEELQRDGTCWVGSTRWRGLPALRVSVSNWSTDDAAVDASVAAMRAALERVLGAEP
jgi:glutamate/tyrosine decarboxylase-like PLP-dependent enzyme